jgi:DNA modification methylase
MDPFNGLGSTAVACTRLGVPEFIGVDIDETYLRAAAERLRDGMRPRMAKASLKAEARAASGGGSGTSGRPGR